MITLKNRYLKNVFLLLILVHIILGVEATSDYKLYMNTKFNFSLQYPSSWTVVEGFMGSAFITLSPLNKDDLFQENINIGIQDLCGLNLTLKQFSDLSYTQLENVITDFQLIAKENAILANNNTEIIIFSGIQGKHRLTWLQIYTLYNEKAYIITYTAESNEFGRYLPFAISVINSFEINTNEE